ncbi:hypothetical protein GCM10010278_19950 [Streptomyces melanogenes]|nr:hypothetical protein GCM10010278_19950 [Streptomyces melanogenes]
MGCDAKRLLEGRWSGDGRADSLFMTGKSRQGGRRAGPWGGGRTGARTRECATSVFRPPEALPGARADPSGGASGEVCEKGPHAPYPEVKQVGGVLFGGASFDRSEIVSAGQLRYA